MDFIDLCLAWLFVAAFIAELIIVILFGKGELW